MREYSNETGNKSLQDYAEEPVFIPAEVKEDMVVRSAVADNGVRFPAQKVEGGIVVIAEMKRGETLTLTPDSEPVLPDIELKSDEAKSSLDMVLNNELFTSYVYDKKFAKPYLGPVLAKDGTSYTRLDFETKEHPHQRSVFTGVGDVNGVDFGMNGEFGYQTHQVSLISLQVPHVQVLQPISSGMTRIKTLYG